MNSFKRVAIAAPLLALAIGLSPATVRAQVDGDGYRLRAPSGSLSFRMGFAKASASSEIFAFTNEHLTLERGDFSGLLFAADAGFLFGERFEALLGASMASRRAQSNYRDFVDNDDLEIEQETKFDRAPLTVGVRYFLTPIGRRVGNFAWVPARFAPYVSAGGGMVYYRFDQRGDFVDFQTLDVFPAELESSAWAPTVFGALGMHYAFTPRTALATEIRYDRARAPMDTQFRGFDNIDLSGTSLTVGLHFRL